MTHQEIVQQLFKMRDFLGEGEGDFSLSLPVRYTFPGLLLVGDLVEGNPETCMVEYNLTQNKWSWWSQDTDHHKGVPINKQSGVLPEFFVSRIRDRFLKIHKGVYYRSCVDKMKTDLAKAALKKEGIY